MRSEKPQSVPSYLEGFPSEIQARMKRVREAILQQAPDAEELISYGMPAYKTFGRPLIYFAGYEKHIGLYATPSGQAAFAGELAAYKQGKGSVQFPNDAPFPLPLIKKIIAFRVEENRLKYAPADPFASLAAPARRALSAAGIKQLKDLSRISEASLRELHGIGPNAIKTIRQMMASKKIYFKK